MKKTIGGFNKNLACLANAQKKKPFAQRWWQRQRRRPTQKLGQGSSRSQHPRGDRPVGQPAAAQAHQAAAEEQPRVLGHGCCFWRWRPGVAAAAGEASRLGPLQRRRAKHRGLCLNFGAPSLTLFLLSTHSGMVLSSFEVSCQVLRKFQVCCLADDSLDGPTKGILSRIGGLR